MEVRNLSENDIIWEDVVQYPGHRMENSRWQRISKGKMKYMVAQDLETLTLAGNSPWGLHHVIPILTWSYSILKCWRMLPLERKDVPETPCSCSQKPTTYSLRSYSRVSWCLFIHTHIFSALVYSSLLLPLRNISPEKILLWHALLLQVSLGKLFRNTRDLKCCLFFLNRIGTQL